MVTPNWGLLQSGQNALSMFQAGAQIGQSIRERREEERRRNALTEYAANPGQGTLGGVIQADPRLGIQLQQQEQDRAAQEQKLQRQKMLDVARLLNEATPKNYGQVLGAAQQMGIDVTRVPQQFDPNWIAQQKLIVSSFLDDKDDTLPGIAQELVAAGYQPGTPEFANAMRSVINSKYASDYVDAQGNTRRRSVLNLQQPAAPSGPQPGAVEDGYIFKGGNPADPNSWEPVSQGGPQVAPAAGFPTAAY